MSAITSSRQAFTQSGIRQTMNLNDTAKYAFNFFLNGVIIGLDGLFYDP